MMINKKVMKQKIKDEKNEILFKIYLDKLDKLAEIENKSKLNIINNFLVIELLSISFTTEILLLKNDIKFASVKTYLKSAGKFYNNNLEIKSSIKKQLVEMSEEEEKYFSNSLKQENEIVNKYVNRLNNVFLVKYENDSWERFNMLYNIENDYFNSYLKIKKLNQKLEKVLTDIIAEKNLNDIYKWDIKKEMNPLYNEKNMPNQKEIKKLLPSLQNKFYFSLKKFNF